MNHQPLLSIVTASLNAESTIRSTLKSVSCQRDVSVEHIVCDGGSTDETLHILEEYNGSYNLRWISEPDSGISEALNKGISWSSGKYILVLQADDYLMNTDLLKMIRKQLEKATHDIFSYPVIIDHPTRGPLLRKPIRFIWWNRFKFVLPHQGCFVKRKVFDKIGGFNTSFHISMDYDFFYRALKHKCSIKFFDTPVSIMGSNGLSSSIEFVPKRLKEDRQVQAINENNQFWRAAQKFFWTLYIPYKKGQLMIA